MTIPPQPPRPNAEYQYRHVATPAPDVIDEPAIKHAPSLRQFWRSDARLMPGRKRPSWAGVLSFWLGLGAAAMLIGGTAFEVSNAAAIALGLGTVGVFFGLVALIAGIGPGRGFLGIVLALIGNVFVLSWLGENVF